MRSVREANARIDHLNDEKELRQCVSIRRFKLQLNLHHTNSFSLTTQSKDFRNNENSIHS